MCRRSGRGTFLQLPGDGQRRLRLPCDRRLPYDADAVPYGALRARRLRVRRGGRTRAAGRSSRTAPATRARRCGPPPAPETAVQTRGPVARAARRDPGPAHHRAGAGRRRRRARAGHADLEGRARRTRRAGGPGQRQARGARPHRHDRGGPPPPAGGPQGRLRRAAIWSSPAPPAPARRRSPGCTARSWPRSACWSAGIWSRCPGWTWSASTSARRRSAPRRRSTGRAAVCCSSTRRTRCRPEDSGPGLRQRGHRHAGEADGGPPGRGGGDRRRATPRRWSASCRSTPVWRPVSHGPSPSATTSPRSCCGSWSSRPRSTSTGSATGTGEALLKYFTALPKGPAFGNGRTARQTFEAMVERHAGRVAQLAEPSTDDLTLLYPEDLPELP